MSLSTNKVFIYIKMVKSLLILHKQNKTWFAVSLNEQLRGRSNIWYSFLTVPLIIWHGCGVKLSVLFLPIHEHSAASSSERGVYSVSLLLEPSLLLCQILCLPWHYHLVPISSGDYFDKLTPCHNLGIYTCWHARRTRCITDTDQWFKHAIK